MGKDFEAALVCEYDTQIKSDCLSTVLRKDESFKFDERHVKNIQELEISLGCQPNDRTYILLLEILFPLFVIMS